MCQFLHAALLASVIFSIVRNWYGCTDCASELFEGARTTVSMIAARAPDNDISASHDFFFWLQGVRESSSGEASSVPRYRWAAAASSGWRGGRSVLRHQHCRVLRRHPSSIGGYDQVSHSV